MNRSRFHPTVYGWVIVAACGGLFTVGLCCIYVTDTHYAQGHDGAWNAAKQSIFGFMGVVLFLVLLRIGYYRIARQAVPVFVIAVLVLVPLVLARVFHVTFGGLIRPRNGAFRWIDLPGFQFQPSEIVKIAYVLWMAWYLRYRTSFRTFGGLLIPLVGSAVPFALVLLEPDLGTVLLLITVMFGMLFAAGARVSHLSVLLLIAIAAAPPAWDQIKGYQRARVTAVLLQSPRLRQAVIDHPERFELLATRRQAVEWSVSSGYQLVHSKNAIGSGGLLGMGWGKGIYCEHHLLPDRHNDFVFSLIGHQWGLVGGAAVLMCFAVVIGAGGRIACATTEPVGRMLAVGLTTLLASQVIINVGMTVGLLPTTGMTLPFVSYGGSSLLTNISAIALLISVSQFRPFLLEEKPFQFGEQIEVRPPLTVDRGLNSGKGRTGPVNEVNASRREVDNAEVR